MAEDPRPPAVSVLVPFRPSDSHRQRAFEFVWDHYRRNHPSWELLAGTCENEWSKGEAVGDAFRRANGDALVIADADSYLTPPETLSTAVETLNSECSWVVPHTWVRRLNRRATELVYAGKEPKPGQVSRNPYVGPPGGGVVVLTRGAYETVGGIDERFKGWGGEDISLGWALETLAGPFVRLGGTLWHLHHPHAAPRLRGSPESEALAGRYAEAFHVPRLMRALVDRAEPDKPEPLVSPVRFRSERESRLVRLGTRRYLFRNHCFETTDPDVAHALRQVAERYQVEEVPGGLHPEPQPAG